MQVGILRMNRPSDNAVVSQYVTSISRTYDQHVHRGQRYTEKT